MMQDKHKSLKGQTVIGILADSPVELVQSVFKILECELELFAAETTRRPTAAAVDFGHKLLTGGVDVAVFQSSFGVASVLASASQSIGESRFLDSLSDIHVVAANSNVASKLQALGIEATLPPEPGRWRELLIHLDQNHNLANLNIAVEQFVDVRELTAGLESRGARVVSIPVLPPLESGLQDELSRTLAKLDQAIMLFVDSPVAASWLLNSFPAEQRRKLNAILPGLVTLAATEETKAVMEPGLRSNFQTLNLEDPKTTEPTTLANSIRTGFELLQNKTAIRFGGNPQVENGQRWNDSPFMKACRGEPTDVTPIWMMRQAGRYMAEYREVRAKVSFLDLCHNPQLCSEVMCTAVDRLGVDAAIIFSDLLPILVPMGCDLEFVKGDGPVIHNPIRTSSDIDRIKPLENLDELWFVAETVKQTRADLPDHLPLIGFAGAPFTLASYMIEGGASRNYQLTKQLMFSDQGAWHELMSRLSDSISLYLMGQVEAGAQCLQLFDSWAGCLNYEDYRQFVLPYVKRIIASLPMHVPVINFATGNPGLLPLLADTQANVIGIDWRMRLDDAWQIVGHDRSVQGNLDPTVLFTDPEYIKTAAKVVLDQAAGRPGHIFNLGHGILPTTPVENAIALVDAVHELSAR